MHVNLFVHGMIFFRQTLYWQDFAETVAKGRIADKWNSSWPAAQQRPWKVWKSEGGWAANGKLIDTSLMKKGFVCSSPKIWDLGKLPLPPVSAGPAQAPTKFVRVHAYLQEILITNVNDNTQIAVWRSSNWPTPYCP